MAAEQEIHLHLKHENVEFITSYKVGTRSVLATGCPAITLPPGYNCI